MSSQLWLMFAYTYHLEMAPDTHLLDGVFACQEKCLPCCLCFVRPFLLGKLSNINKDRTTVIILLQNTHIHVARQRANANHSLQHLHTLSWGAQFSKRNPHPACQHLAVCLGTRLSRNLPECFPHATRLAS